MSKPNFYLLALAMLLPILFTACDDDMPEVEGGVFHPQLGWLNKGAAKYVVGIESEAHHQHGQDHRSSGNFDTRSLPAGDYYYWEVDSAAQADGVSFRVMKDNKGKDDVIEEYVTHGSLTKVYKSDKLYIADPKNAKKKFSVTVSCVKGDEESIYVTCAKDHQQGQKHRASANFDFKHALYQVVVPNDDIRFCICNDVSGGNDGYVYRDLRNSQIIAQSSDYNLYLADVTGAEGPFTLQLKPVTRAWMSEIPDSRLISSLSIPGTHDTGTYNCSAGMSKCQNFSIACQLEYGIRAFDIRFDSEMDIRHGPTDCGIKMHDVLRQMNAFLDKNPNECILMILNQHGKDDYPKLKAFFDDNPELVCHIDRNIVSLPKLGRARGKIIILRRFPKPSSTFWGIDFTDWPDDGAKEVNAVAENGDKVKYYIQDRYFSADETIHDTEEKTQCVLETMEKAVFGEDECLFINYNSIAGRVTHTPWSYAWTTGNAILPINPTMMYSLRDNLLKIRQEKSSPTLRLGIVMLDFYNRHGNDDDCRNTEAILNTNFEKPLY